MRVLSVRHLTTYRYAEPVELGEHRMMFRPRESHDLRLIRARLDITPRPAALRWLHDVFDNSVAVANFDGTTTWLRFDSMVTLEHVETSLPDYALQPTARSFPFNYPQDEWLDLAPALQRPEPTAEVDRWAAQFVPESPSAASTIGTMDLLRAMAFGIRRQFRYIRRVERGVQSPIETLRHASGTCRDFAWLMIDAVRSLGLAARFVSGYIFVPGPDSGSIANRASAAAPISADAPHSVAAALPIAAPLPVAAPLPIAAPPPIAAPLPIAEGGATHAWLQVYLPGAGWVDFDPTNSIIGNRNLIRVAVAWSPMQVLPLWGTYVGTARSCLGMQVAVSVTEEPCHINSPA
ncbi:MAG TPA: transglutaminase family protein [Acetobacteraceae bacterium]|jgi:transglutaminase-like putative cysteine protease|nr:transglutaminase family protein [Acetobacteraceae bacterium]